MTLLQFYKHILNHGFEGFEVLMMSYTFFVLVVPAGFQKVFAGPDAAAASASAHCGRRRLGPGR